ncbi:MAG: glutathione-dependent formaldehyde dehydrogenase [Dehalococcoidales bacterium]|nr:glutathione-dependent formaldehyde dehydrogenase [Dehalococcoidales bacterium]
MRAVVFHGIGDIRLEDVPEPKLEQPQDAIVRITTSAVCGTDLHMIRGTMPGMVPGTIMGHEGVGIVEEVGSAVRNLQKGDRVVIPSTIACGYCSYCRAGYYSQCDNANPNGPLAGTAYFGGPKSTGPFNGLQAQYARVPFAPVGLVKLPDSVPDEQAILLSDVFPTGYFGADIADIEPGRTVAVFGCGPVGLFAIASAFLMGAGRVFAVDTIPSRLDMARQLGAEVIDFNKDDPIEAIRELTGNIGVDRVIDAVGVDAVTPHSGPAAEHIRKMQKAFQEEQQQVAPQQNPQGPNWHPGDAPSLALQWEVECIAKAGTLAIIGVYPEQVRRFPIGMAMNKNLKINSGNCPHRHYVPQLVDLVEAGEIDPTMILTEELAFDDVIEAYKRFDRREPGWVKVAVEPDRTRGRQAA